MPPVATRLTKRKTVAAPRIPPDLAKALRGHENAYGNFRGFAPSQRLGIIEWITMAKRPQTRARRIAEAVKFAGWNVEVKTWRWGK